MEVKLVKIDDVKPGRLVSRTGRKLDSRAKTFEGLKQAAEKSEKRCRGYTAYGRRQGTGSGALQKPGDYDRAQSDD